MARPCEPPLCVFRLNYIDMCSWQNSEQAYQDAFEQLLEALDSALRGEPHYRWAEPPPGAISRLDRSWSQRSESGLLLCASQCPWRLLLWWAPWPAAGTALGLPKAAGKILRTTRPNGKHWENARPVICGVSCYGSGPLLER